MAEISEPVDTKTTATTSPEARQADASAHDVNSAIDSAAAAGEAPREIPPPEPFAQRLAAVRAADNPLLEASRVLLRAQADMPEKLDSKQAIATLRSLLDQELHIFHKLCEQANIRRDHMVDASYCLCTALDEAATQTTWGKGGNNGVEWITTGLATTIHKDRQGGDKVYLLIGRLLAEPQEHPDLLEVIYRVLSLGFEGRYRHETDGRRKHDAIRQRLYNEIMSRQEPVPFALSPNWQSDVPAKRMSFFDVPVWISVTVLSVTLLGFYGYFKYELLNRTAEVQKQIADIGRMTPPPAPPILHLKALLKDEIAAGTVSVDEDERHSAVTFPSDAMFAPGDTSVKESMHPLIAKVAGEIAKVPGKVTILGYTDNVPIRNRKFASNEALSKERATHIKQMLQAAGVPASRLEAIGRGNANPVGDNRTAQGRARNRRVEIVVAQ